MREAAEWGKRRAFQLAQASTAFCRKTVCPIRMVLFALASSFQIEHTEVIKYIFTLQYIPWQAFLEFTKALTTVPASRPAEGVPKQREWMKTPAAIVNKSRKAITFELIPFAASRFRLFKGFPILVTVQHDGISGISARIKPITSHESRLREDAAAGTTEHRRSSVYRCSIVDKSPRVIVFHGACPFRGVDRSLRASY